jgi:excisionase family DNA binding protein
MIAQVYELEKTSMNKPGRRQHTVSPINEVASKPESRDAINEGLMTLRLYTITELQASLQVSKRTIYRWIATGTLPCIRFGGRIRVTHDDLIAFLDAHRSEG